VPAILPNYEYDIFISYRQNDNKPATAGGRDGWVTSFVAALKDELEAALKSPVSIYFDANPHDGLLETHQVNASLEKKLKCLIFIPIISQTYCDTSSFAWEHEFLPFLKIAGEDELGMNVTLPNGNVASRVLPVKIHELDAQDQVMLEKELGGPLRSIKFIHQAAGVNRPLTVQDDQVRESGKILYRDQINKVANALKEIGNALLKAEKAPLPTSVEDEQSRLTPPSQDKKPSIKNILIAVAASLILVLGYFLYPASPKISGTHDYDIAVMYLENLTDDPKYGDGLVNLIQINLSEDTSINLVPRQKLYDELKEISGSSSSPDQSVATELASEIDAEFMIIGRVIQQKLEVLAQVELIEVATGKVVATKKVQGNKEEIFLLADNITKQLMQGRLPERSYDVTSLTTGNYDAYQLYYDGLEHIWNLAFAEASAKFEAAIQLDSTFALAYMYNAMATNPFGDYDIYKDMSESNAYLEEAYRRSSSLPSTEQLMVKMMYELSTGNANYDSTNAKLLEADPDNRLAVTMAGISFYGTGTSDKASFEIVKDYLIRNPKDDAMWNGLAYRYIGRGQYEQAVEAVNRYRELRPNLFNAIHSSWEINFMAGNFEKAVFYAEQIKNNFNSGNHGVWLGLTNLVLGNSQGALDTYLLYRDSTNYRNLQSLGFDSYLMQGKIKKSMEMVDVVVDRYQSMGETKIAATMKLNKPYILFRFGKFDEALAELDKIISQATGDDEMTIIVFMAEYYKGISYILSADTDAATSQVNILKALRNSNNTDQRYDLYIQLLEAELALAQGDLDKTIYALDGDEKLFRFNNPKYFEIKINYLIGKNRLQEALNLLDRINKEILSGRYAFGGNQTIYTINLMFRDYYKGVVYEKLNQPKEAIEAYGAFLELLKDSDPGIREKEDAERRVKMLAKKATS
jgi:tetratricopeptide (TPR) repeat protein